MTHEEANAILNRFMGWQTGARCPECNERPTHRTPDDTWWDTNAHFWKIIPPFDYFADTPEAREQVRLLKDEFVRRLHGRLSSAVHWDDGSIHFTCYITTPGYWVKHQPIESHAIAFAIAAALKDQEK